MPGFSESSTGQSADWVTVRPGQRAYLDVFFPIGPLAPTPVSLIWLLHHGAQAVQATTVFALLPGASSWMDARYGPADHVGGEPLWGPLWFAPLVRSNEVSISRM